MKDQYCEIQNPPIYTETVRRWNNETEANGSDMGADVEKLVNNDAYLKQEVERLNETKIAIAEKGIPNGTASLGADGKLAQRVEYAKVDNVPAPNWNALANKPSSFPPSSHTHTKAEVGLGNVDNTADAAKSVNYAASAGNADTVDGKHAAAFANASHTHSRSQITDFPDALKNPAALTIKMNGSSQGAYDGSAAKTINITASGIGAAASSHTHKYSTATNVTNGDGRESVQEGSSATASGACSHAEGTATIASNVNSHAQNYNTLAQGYCSTACGQGTIANLHQFVIGCYNVESGNPNSGISSDTNYFIIGDGNINTRRNIFRVKMGGVYSKGSYNTSGADYAEYFQWADGNQNQDDRVGYFVTLDGDQIEIASPGEYILGIISSTPSVIGNSYDDQWHGMELLDDWGRPIFEEYTEPAEYREMETGDGTVEQVLMRPEMSGMRPKGNPDYDNTQPYIGRSKRPEWSPVGMLGVLRVRDDGTCKVNGYCTVADGGIATAAPKGYRVISRITDHIIKIVFR